MQTTGGNQIPGRVNDPCPLGTATVLFTTSCPTIRHILRKRHGVHLRRFEAIEADSHTRLASIIP